MLKMNIERDFKACSRCILDTNDYPDIIFDAQGVCNICHIYDILENKTIFRGDVAKDKLGEMLAFLKKSRKKNSQYDCIVGTSGGVDSTYLLYLTKEWGLNPLAVHVDNGWNSDLAVKNIQSVLNKLSVDLYTYVINWEDMRDMHLSFLKASVMDIELPFDNTFMAALFKIAYKFNLKNILLGYNTETEGWLPPNFSHYKLDSLNIHAIHNKFGEKRITDFPTIGIFKSFLYKYFLHIGIHSPLNYVKFNKNEVKGFLIDKLDWRDYGYKHYENIFTRFYQGYILPQKFNIDKRKSHLSTLICSGQISRDYALEEIKKPIYSTDLLITDKAFIIKKLGITQNEFEDIMNLPVCMHTDYPSYVNYIKKLRKLKSFFTGKPLHI